jgi:hypothetical protein
MDFGGALVEQEQAAEDQDDVAPGKFEAADRENRLSELGDPHQEGQHHDAQAERPEQADFLGDRTLGRVQLLGGDGEKDQIVDAKNDFEDGER